MLVLLFCFIRGGLAVPIHTLGAASNNPVQFINDSSDTNSTRSVVGIIWSCITTIFACTWVAIHPNIPSEAETDWAIYRRRARILIVALIAPEYIILWAANQFRSARHTVRELRQFPSCRNWTMTHGMFLVMGGFVLTDSSGKRIGILQEIDLVKLLSTGQIVFPHLSCSEIMDKSKGDAITKTLVLIQTTWFMLQVISRALQHLPITELELTTSAFALLNILTYTLWWKKPMDVRHPVLISLPENRNRDPIDFARKSLLSLEEVDITDSVREEYSQAAGNSSLSESLPIVQDFAMSRDRTSSSLSQPQKDTLQVSLPIRACLQVRNWIRSLSYAIVRTQYLESLSTVTKAFIRPWPSEVETESKSKALISTLVPSSQKRTLASRVPISQLAPDDNINVYSGLQSTTYSLPSLEFATAVPTFYGGPVLTYSHGIGLLYPTALEMSIGFIFGAIHCAAWRFQFPSKVEQILWRTTSLCITCAPLALWATWLLIQALWPISTTFSMHRIRYFVFKRVMMPFITWTQPFRVIFVLYIASRLATFVLAFVLLRDLPPGALQDVIWTTFIPHV